MSEIQGAIAGAMAAMQLVKGAIAARDDLKVQSAVAEMYERLSTMSVASLGLTGQVAALQSQLRAMEEKNRDIQAQLDERGAYDLHEISPGKFCYRAKEVEGSTQPMHHLCQICLDKRIKSVLQLISGLDPKFPRLQCLEVAEHALYIDRR